MSVMLGLAIAHHGAGQIGVVSFSEQAKPRISGLSSRGLSSSGLVRLGLSGRDQAAHNAAQQNLGVGK